MKGVQTIELSEKNLEKLLSDDKIDFVNLMRAIDEVRARQT
jgi:hypothetical protein